MAHGLLAGSAPAAGDLLAGDLPAGVGAATCAQVGRRDGGEG